MKLCSSKACMLAASLLLVGTIGRAQQTAPLVNTPIPPSPASSVFHQFAGYTPNLSTGTVSVPISLYDVQVGDYTLPLSMQYYTQGIRVTDDPYPLGYGWLLSPGLRITRTIMGRPDMYYTPDVQPSAPDNWRYGRSALYNEESFKHPDLNNPSSFVDTQHDIFTVHLPAGDYAFLLNRQSDGTYTAVSCNNLLKIVPDGLRGFTVTDGEGVIYHFGDSGQTQGDYTEIYHNRYVTAWMLRRIELPGSGRVIDFDWEYAHHTTLGTGMQRAGDVVADFKENHGEIPADPNPTYTSAYEMGLSAEYGNYNQMLHLKQVRFPGGTVELTYQGATHPMLTRLKVSNLFGSIVRNIDFVYGTGIDAALLLSANFSDEGTYRFEYDPGRFVYTHGQDWWGFYNGKNNDALVPKMSVKTYNNRLAGGPSSYETFGQADRTADAAAMQANLLKKIIYPTGGYTAFEYEPHRFTGSLSANAALGSQSRFRLTMGGGLRVCKITSRAGNDAPDVVKRYKYGKGENGLGNVLYEPTLETFIDELNGYSMEHPQTGIHPVAYNHRLLLLNTHSCYRRYALNTPDLWYDTVTEYVEGAGKTVYTFCRIVPENAASSETIHDFSQRSPLTFNTLFSKGCLPAAQVDYKKTGSSYTPVQQTDYTYSLVEETDKRIIDAYVSRRMLSLLPNGPDLLFESTGWPTDGSIEVGGSQPLGFAYTVHPLGIRFYYEQLKSKSITAYSEQGRVNRTEDYTYSVYQLSDKRVTCGDGTVTTEQYFYPKDYADHKGGASDAQQSVLKNMLTRNIRTPLFRQVRTCNGSSESVRTEFAYYHSSFYKPSKVYYRESCLAEYDYDIAGNVCSLTENGSLKQAFLWGYNYTLPVLAVKGMSYAEMRARIGIGSAAAVNGTNASDIAAAIGSAKQAVDEYAHATAYTYLPLIGQSSITAPNGNRTTYAYDAAGRLSAIHDHDRHLQQSFAYHLANGGDDTGGGSPTPGTTMQFTGVHTAGGTGSGSIVCQNPCVVHFYLHAECSAPDGYAEYMLAGNYHTLSGANGKAVTLKLDSGTHSFTVSLNHAGESSRASITIQGTDQPNTLGTVTTIEAYQ